MSVQDETIGTMILAMNPADSHSDGQLGVFSKLFTAKRRHERTIVTPQRADSSPDSSTTGSSSSVKKDSDSAASVTQPTKKTTRRRRRRRAEQQEPADEQIGKGLVEMAEAQTMLGHWEKAFELWDRAIEIQREKLGPRHPTVACTLVRRGNACAHLGHWYPAVLDMERAAHIYQSTPNNDRLAADTLLQLAAAQVRMDHWDDAVANMKVALSINEKLQDEENVAKVNCEIANIHQQQRNYEEAMELYRVGLERYEQAGVDKNHPDVVWATRRASCRSMQGHLFWSRGDDKKT